MNAEFNRVTVITGHYGCGKTNLAVNAALHLCENSKVCLIDLDIVNPYFRSADFEKLFEEKGIKLVRPNYANTNLDIPSFNFDLEQIIRDNDHTIIDVGGDDSGAFALGKFKTVLERYENYTEVLYTFNMYRDIKDDADETVRLMKEIEAAGRIKCTALVNSSNLGADTIDETVESSLGFAQSVSEKSGLPIAFTCVPVLYKGKINTKIFETQRLVKAPWERQ